MRRCIGRLHGRLRGRASHLLEQPRPRERGGSGRADATLGDACWHHIFGVLSCNQQMAGQMVSGVGPWGCMCVPSSFSGTENPPA